jgi:small subunit ribosomal protein S17
MNKNRKKLTGIVIGDKMEKTVVVQVTRRVTHPRWQKVITIKKKFYAHDPKEEFKPGDKVIIEESRPLSKVKRWKVLQRLEKGIQKPEDSLETTAETSVRTTDSI